MTIAPQHIAIITQPLKNNYGCLLQNFALQKILRQLNYEPITIDYINNRLPPLWLFIGSWIKTILVFIFTGKKRGFAKYGKIDPRKKWSESFISTFINKTRIYSKYSNKIITENNIKTIVVGSDQVWRPKYNDYLKDMFLDFCKENKHLKRIAYAASFGVDRWEMTRRQTRTCSLLAKLFNNISVREESGVQLCKDYLKVESTWVLDPTLLLSKEEYNIICKDIASTSEKFLAVYILDINESIRATCESTAKELGLTPKFFEAGPSSTLSVPEWLSMFRDASYVITDSFHGTIFSIIYEKKFEIINNESRGLARIHSLMNIYNSGRIDEMRRNSLNWLNEVLKD